MRLPLLLLSAGCLPPTTCETDQDCPSVEVCARTAECVPAGTLKTVRVAWTIDGVQPTPDMPAACTGIDHLVISAYQYQSSAEDDLTYTPVPCTPPLFTFTKLPAYHDTIDLTAEDALGYARAYGSTPIPPGNDVSVTIDLR